MIKNMMKSEKQDMREDLISFNQQSRESEAEAAVAIIKSADPLSILLLRRKKDDNDPWSGHFAFPGGRREEHDLSILHTCIRETREETSIVLSHSMLTKTLSVTAAGRNVLAPVTVQPFLFELQRQPPVVVEESEIETFVWLDIEQFQDTTKHKLIEVLPGMIRPVYPLADY